MRRLARFSQRQIASQAGVSQNTVLRYVHDLPVRSSSERRIRQAVVELGEQDLDRDARDKLLEALPPSLTPD
jgi:transcriptional regulator with XRE-family HTH domain